MATTTKDPYVILNVTQSADAAEIKRAFRELAKKYHPDKTKGDAKAEVKFKEINTAYDILSDPAKRARYDNGEIDADGNVRGFDGGHYGRAYQQSRSNRGQQRADPFSGAGGAGFSAEDIFSELFGTRKTQQQRGSRAGGNPFGGDFGFEDSASPAAKGADTRYQLQITVEEAVLGGKRRLTLKNSKTIDVTVPAGSTDGQTLRLKGLGESAKGGTGDALIELKIEPHAYFTLKGNDVYLDAPISLIEAVQGASITVPTIGGSVSVKVPKGANSGMKLRLKGKGAAPKGSDAGDQYVVLKIMLPESVDSDLEKAIEKWGKAHAYNPREKLYK